MLGRHWGPGTGTVVARRRQGWANSTLYYYEYVLDVEPTAGAPAFRATAVTTTQNRPKGFVEADVGAVIPVFCDVKRKEVRFDTTEQLAEDSAAKDADQAAWDALREGTPRTAAPPGRGGGLVHAEIPGSDGAVSPAGAGTGASDSIERLTELADLHARGALTDAEFAAEKAKILAES